MKSSTHGLGLLSVLVTWLYLTPAQSHILPKRQDQPDFKWAIVGYTEPNCRGEVVANWRGSESVPHCFQINETRSISGGSGDGAQVNLWSDDNCSVAATDLSAAGQDENGYPCFNVALVRSFTVDS